MIRTMMTACMVSLVLATTAQAAPAELWRGLVAGDSEAQVRAKLPTATTNPKPSNLSDGSVGKLQLEKVDVGAADATAVIYFKDDRLSRVVLNVAVQERMTDHNLSVARELAQRLTAKYGEPITCGDRSISRDIPTYKCEWRKSGTEIYLSYIDIAGQSPFLDVGYAPAGKSPADNL